MGSRFRGLGTGFRFQDFGFRVQALGVRVQGLGFRFEERCAHAPCLLQVWGVRCRARAEGSGPNLSSQYGVLASGPSVNPFWAKGQKQEGEEKGEGRSRGRGSAGAEPTPLSLWNRRWEVGGRMKLHRPHSRV